VNEPREAASCMPSTVGTRFTGLDL